jgi:hypothetical protein
MLDGFREQKRMLRTEIRNYIVNNQTDLEVNYKLTIPQNIKNMPKADFDAWLQTLSTKKLPKELKSLYVEYMCACENVVSFAK